jgi:uncharacterized membrane protein
MAEETTRPHHHRLPYILRIIRARPRLATSAVIGLIVIAALPSSWWISTRLLVGWDAGIALYLVLVYTLIARSESGHIRGHALRQDEGRVAMLVLTVFAAVASIGAILGELGTGQATGQGTGQVIGQIAGQVTGQLTLQASPRTSAQLALATVTIVLSWAFIHTIFALHYAHDFYSDHHDKKCLNFPGEEAPDYWDFVYFSFVIGMTSQVSDVTVASRPMRHTVTAHGIVSFFFNASLLALTVNIAASVI